MKDLSGGACLVLALLVFSPAALAQNAVKLRGQVVCSECWFEADDRKAKPYGGEADLACAARCSKAGVPQALAVWEGDAARLYVLEKGAFDAGGKDFLAYVADEVEVTGTTRTDGKATFLKVDALEVVAKAPRPAAPQPAAAAVGVGDDAPELALADLAGVEQRLSAYEGKSIVVLNFWATWCAPCRKEMPAFVRLQGEYAPFGVQVIAASTDEAETRGQVVKYVRENKLGFPVWVGATADDMARFGLGAELPATVVVDRDGKIAAIIRGIVDEADLKKRIDALVEKQAAEAERKAAEGAARHGHHDDVAVAAGGRGSSVPS